MASRTRTKKPDTPGPDSKLSRVKVRIFFHPQRGAVLCKNDLHPGALHYRVGPDSDWREVASVEMIATPDGDLRHALGTVLPRGYLWGDPTKQNFGIGGPERVLGPLEKRCRDCGAPFVFTAAEQKYMYETQRLYVDATSVRCPPCRRARRRLEQKRRAYQSALRAAEEAPSAAAHLAAARAADELIAAGGHAPIDKAVANARRAQKLGAQASGVLRRLQRRRKKT